MIEYKFKAYINDDTITYVCKRDTVEKARASANALFKMCFVECQLIYIEVTPGEEHEN